MSSSSHRTRRVSSVIPRIDNKTYSVYNLQYAAASRRQDVSSRVRRWISRGPVLSAERTAASLQRPFEASLQTVGRASHADFRYQLLKTVGE